MTPEEELFFMRRAVAHLVRYSRTQVGLRAEMYDWGLESDGKLTMTSEQAEEDEFYFTEAQQVLFSCQVAERTIGLNDSDLVDEGDPPEHGLRGEYPKLVASLEEIALRAKANFN